MTIRCWAGTRSRRTCATMCIPSRTMAACTSIPAFPNQAFHRVAVALGGHAWERAGRIWYDALCAPQRRADCSFAEFAGLTLQVATERFGVDSAEEVAVREGWRAVGVWS